jgi:hypothetical protein
MSNAQYPISNRKSPVPLLVLGIWVLSIDYLSFSCRDGVVAALPRQELSSLINNSG